MLHRPTQEGLALLVEIRVISVSQRIGDSSQPLTLDGCALLVGESELPGDALDVVDLH
jgi:hypothetical protein